MRPANPNTIVPHPGSSEPGDPSAGRLLVIGGSAGSLQVILSLLGAIDADFPMPVLVVVHRNGLFESNLEDIFSSRTSLSIKEVEEKDPIRRGTIYLCPADYHVLLEQDNSFSLDYSEKGLTTAGPVSMSAFVLLPMSMDPD